MTRLIGNLVWGLRWGAAFGAACSTWAIIVYIVNRRPAFQAIDLSFPTTVLFYAVTGVGAGVVLGLCRPLLRRKLGAAITGAIIAIPMFFIGSQFLFEGFHRPDLVEILILGSMAIVGGSTTGIILHEIFSAP